MPTLLFSHSPTIPPIPALSFSRNAIMTRFCTNFGVWLAKIRDIYNMSAKMFILVHYVIHYFQSIDC